MSTWHPITLNLFPTRDRGHEGMLTLHLPGGKLIIEVRNWHKVSHHIEAEMRLEIGDDTGPMDPEFEALVGALTGRVEG